MIGKNSGAVLALVALSLAPISALAQSSSDSGSAGQTMSQSSKGASAKRADAADPSHLIDPNRSAAAIIVRKSPDFASIKVEPVSKSGNSQALIRAVLDHDAGLDALHEAIRGNADMMKALKAQGASVDDVVAVTTDRNNDAIVFTRD
jgi:hypothetical protein